MMHPARSLALVLLAAVLSGCGLVTAPVSVPGAIAANANFSLKGPVVDSRGNPLSDVILSQELHHQLWTPVQGYAMTNEHKTFQVNQTVEVNERGSSLHLTFIQTGFHYAEYTVQADQRDLIITPQGEWPARPDFPIVLYPKKPDAALCTFRSTIKCSDYPRLPAIDLAALAGSSTGTVSRRTEPARNVDDIARDRPGLFFLTLTPQTPTPINSQNQVDPQDINLPAEITLHITGSGNGFVPMAPKLGFAPLQTSDTAPTEGYVPTLTIARARLKQMRGANMGLILEPSEYFFFRVGDHFGKGRITWSRRVEAKSKDIAPAEFYFVLFLQPKAGEVNLTSFDAQTRG